MSVNQESLYLDSRGVSKVANISPDEAFVEGIFGGVAVDLVGADCFYFAIGVKNVD